MRKRAPSTFLALAGLFLVLSVVSFMLARASYIEATGWVEHTSEVNLAIARARIAADEQHPTESRSELQKLRELTRDNPRQQARLRAFDPNAASARAKFEELAQEENSLYAARRADQNFKRRVSWFFLAASTFLTFAFAIASVLVSRHSYRVQTAQSALLSSILDGIGDSVVAIDKNRHFIVANATFRRIFREGLEQGGLSLNPANRQDARKEDGSPLGPQEGPLPRALRGEHVDSYVFSIHQSETVNNRIWLDATSRPVIGEDGKIMAAVAVLRDVTRERQDRAQLAHHAEELRQQSLVDELTGLYNRRGFFLLAEQYMRTAARSKRRYCILFADLNGLKAINDTWGHDCGDQAILCMAQILKNSLREADVIGRLGGDEYVALLDGADEALANAVVTRVLHETQLDNKQRTASFKLSVSAGVAAQTEYGAPLSLEALIAQADERMYIHKRNARERAYPAA